MSDEPRGGDQARRARPSRGMRKAMLAGGSAPVPAAPVRRQSLAEALAHIPDMEHEAATASWPTVEPVPVEHEGWAGNGAGVGRAGRADAGAPLVAPAWPAGGAASVEPSEGPHRDSGPIRPGPTGRRARRSMPAERAPALWHQQALFGIVIVALVAAIPVLGWVGVKLIRDSRGGTYRATSSDPSAPGYEALVEPTPTALVVERNTDGTPNALTFVGLGNTKGGGSVMFIPLDTKVLEPLPNVDRLRAAYTPTNQPATALKGLSNYAAITLGVGFSDTISIDDAGWEELLAKLAPIQIQNPDALTVGPVQVPVGTVQLQANQIGPYLAASVPGESDLNRLNRHEIVWRAILGKLAVAGGDALSGESSTGLGRYLRDLSAGATTYQTLPVTQDAGAATFTISQADLKASLLAAVPFPQSPVAGARASVRVLDGVSANPRGTGLTRPLVEVGATIAAVGNGPAFGQKTTVWSYSAPSSKRFAVFLRQALGGKGTLRYDPGSADVADVTVVFGKDLRDHVRSMSANGAATTTTGSTTQPGTGTTGAVGG